MGETTARGQARIDIPLLLMLALAILLRWLFYWVFPAFLTADSWDYLVAAHGLAASLDFAGQGLRDLRMPGYPALLAATAPITNMQSERIVLLQTLLGVLAVWLAYVAGQEANSRFTALGFALFLAIHPLYLLFEHTLMTELFGSVLLVAFMAAVTWACNRPQSAARAGLLVGTTFSFCVLTRANMLIFCTICLLAPPVCWYWQARKGWNKQDNLGESGVQGRLQSKNLVMQRHSPLLRFCAAAGVAIILLVGPWLLRNYQLYGNIKLLNSINRNLILYKAMYEPPDTQLPLISALNQTLGTDTIDYQWLWQLMAKYSSNEAEEIALDLWWEQITNHPAEYAEDIAQGMLGFTGLYYTRSGDLHAVQAWLGDYMTDDARLQEHNQSFAGVGGLRYTPAQATPLLSIPMLAAWSWLGHLYLFFVRPLLTLGLLALAAVYIRRQTAVSAPGLTSRDLLILTLLAAYIASAAVHVVTLAVNDRFVSTFDVVPVFLSLLMIDSLRRTHPAPAGTGECILLG